MPTTLPLLSYRNSRGILCYKRFPVWCIFERRFGTCLLSRLQLMNDFSFIHRHTIFYQYIQLGCSGLKSKFCHKYQNKSVITDLTAKFTPQIGLQLTRKKSDVHQIHFSPDFTNHCYLNSKYFQPINTWGIFSLRLPNLRFIVSKARKVTVF
jgi:hypothetical protein